MTIHDIRRQNLQRLVSEKYGGVQARLAEAIGRPANYVWRLLHVGPHAKGIGEELALVIEAAAGVPQYWLDHVARDVLAERAAADNVQGAPTRRRREVNLLTWDALRSERGPGENPSNETARRVIALYNDDEVGERAFALTVNGSDMAPDLAHGEVVVLNPDIEPRAGDIVLADVDGSPMLRTFRPRATTGGSAELTAANPNYAPIWTDRARVRIVAVVVQHLRSRSARMQH